MKQREKILKTSSGYISVKYIKEGEVAIPGAPLAEIVNPDVVYLNIYIPEDEVPNVSINQVIRVKVDALPDRIFKGRVVFISEEAEFTPKNIQTREDRTFLVYRVKMLLDNPDNLIKPGIYGDAFLK
ncbi:MAG: efflux RND transporter periplasmic adaptor subunit [candidate division WOR-3 bacterium]|nr:efflux RND transporter periplasmic adaptor subunit [candidate division WOR-3 bacterium]